MKKTNTQKSRDSVPLKEDLPIDTYFDPCYSSLDSSFKVEDYHITDIFKGRLALQCTKHYQLESIHKYLLHFTRTYILLLHPILHI